MKIRKNRSKKILSGPINTDKKNVITIITVITIIEL